MTSLPFIKRKSFIDILSHIKPHFNPAYIKDVISKHVLHCQSITFYRVDLLGKCFQNTFIAIHVCPPLTHVYCLKVWWRLNLRVWWGSIYTAKTVCQTFLALHHFLGELHQPHSIFGSWLMHLRHPTDVFQGCEADVCRVSHAPLMTSHLLTWQLPWVSRDLADLAIWSLFEVVTMPSIMSESPLQEH